jgi:O-acetylserine/cysteine efflux transporter
MLLKESISRKKWFFVVGAFIGITIVGFDPKIVDNIFALFLTALMAFFYGISNVISRQINNIRVVTQTSIMSLIGLIILFLLSYFFEDHMIDNIKNIRFDVWLLIFHAGLIVSVIAHMSLFYLYKFYTIGTVFPYYSLFPIFGIIQTLIIFQEIPTLITILGGIIVISSVFMLQKIR